MPLCLRRLSLTCSRGRWKAYSIFQQKVTWYQKNRTSQNRNEHWKGKKNCTCVYALRGHFEIRFKLLKLQMFLMFVPHFCRSIKCKYLVLQDVLLSRERETVPPWESPRAQLLSLFCRPATIQGWTLSRTRAVIPSKLLLKLSFVADFFNKQLLTNEHLSKSHQYSIT